MSSRLTDREFIDAFKTYPTVDAMAKALNITPRGIFARRKRVEARHGILLEASRPPPAPRSKAHVTKITREWFTLSD